MANILPNDKLSRLFDLLMKGHSVRECARLVPCSKVTVSRYRILIRAMDALGDSEKLPRCKCGQRADHRGWCTVRYSKSPARQAAMRRLHQNQVGRPSNRLGR